MVNFTVGYGAQYRTNHAVTWLHRAVRLVSPVGIYTYTRAHDCIYDGRSSCDGCTGYTYTCVWPPARTTHLRRVIDERIKRDGSIRDEAIDFEMLDFVSISIRSCAPQKERDNDNARPRYSARIMGQIER